MNSFRFAFVYFAFPIFLASFAQASVLLPLTTVRDQSDTFHCWAYASSHLLESRSLVRDSMEVVVNVEKDVKYWVDYERMMYNFRSKKDFYLGDNEGGWQIEFMETLFKHGKNLKLNQPLKVELTYEPLVDLLQGLPYMPEPRPVSNSELLPLYLVGHKMREFTNEQDAHNFAIDYLNRYYGEPLQTTAWNGAEIPVTDTAKVLLGKDFENNQNVEAFVLVKPVWDGHFGWAQYLEDRYWGYRYDQAKILSLIELSLSNNWPVTFDNVYHAMTIIGFTQAADGVKHYAVADSIPGKITWYDEARMISELNLVTFFKEAIASELPERSGRTLVKIVLPKNKTIDQLDNVTTPPR